MVCAAPAEVRERFELGNALLDATEAAEGFATVRLDVDMECFETGSDVFDCSS
jgi:hypothetical protein